MVRRLAAFRRRAVRRCAERWRQLQTEGGARARNGKCGEDADANFAVACRPVEPECAGNGKSGAKGGAEAATSCNNAQIGQSVSSDPSGLWLGAGSLSRTVPGPIVADVGEAGTRLWRWTCPNDSANWTANATSARREPNCSFDRNQRISLCLFSMFIR
jgi:hypothetical protein